LTRIEKHDIVRHQGEQAVKIAGVHGIDPGLNAPRGFLVHQVPSATSVAKQYDHAAIRVTVLVSSRSSKQSAAKPPNDHAQRPEGEHREPPVR
jgi:hypothetical protein